MKKKLFIMNLNYNGTNFQSNRRLNVKKINQF